MSFKKSKFKKFTTSGPVAIPHKCKKNNQAGFTLMEVMIAITIFAVFVAAFMAVQGDNISDSIRYNQELVLHQMCEEKINEIMINPPDLKDSLTLAPDIKSVEGKADYEYIVEYKRLEIPDLAKIQGKKEGEEDSQDNPLFKMIYDRMKTNLKEMVWQVRVTVKNKQTGENYSLSTWLGNSKAKVNLGI